MAMAELKGAVWISARWNETGQCWVGGYWYFVADPGPTDFTREQLIRLQLMRRSVEYRSRYADDLAPAEAGEDSPTRGGPRERE